MTNWAVPEHSRTQVRRAGGVIGRGESDAAEIEEARAKLSNYRSAHGYPLLSVAMHVRDKAIAIAPDAVVARRLKRLPTILDKLTRQPHMNVTTMQDLGGCRVIVAGVGEVYAIVEALQSARPRTKIIRSKDYIAEPQQTGYRGVHLVYEYGAIKMAYRGLKIEVQVRSELQHAWATAVETMDLFSGSRLKYNEAEPALLRYFAVVGSLMAAREDTPPVVGAEGSVAELRAELIELERRHGVTHLLGGYSAVVTHLTALPKSDRRKTMVLKLWRNIRQIGVSVFETQAEAEGHLALIEAVNDDNVDAVLISVSRVGQIQSAYPNYFANTDAFVVFVLEEIAAV
ncbi:RelA/SpoT domain-containing protein [Microbacterium sp. NPDC076768]|uniref:RelA/SpoT domain-containing protein n=1 Tax=Microbacterium sp. NPDC076768 TaxID=3154858 RepID=UPI003441F28E